MTRDSRTWGSGGPLWTPFLLFASTIMRSTMYVSSPSWCFLIVTLANFQAALFLPGRGERALIPSAHVPAITSKVLY